MYFKTKQNTLNRTNINLTAKLFSIFIVRYQIEDGYDLSAVSGATDYTILQAWDMTHAQREEAPSRAVQHSPLHRDPGAASRDQRYDNIVSRLRQLRSYYDLMCRIE